MGVLNIRAQVSFRQFTHHFADEHVFGAEFVR